MGTLLFIWLISGCLLFVPFILYFISNRKTKPTVVKYLDKMIAMSMGIFCIMGGIFLISKTYDSIVGIIASLIMLLFGLLLICIGIRMKPDTLTWDKWWQKKCESLDEDLDEEG